jgi:ribosomal protein S18 acetylase RimI-like enzyme
MIMKPEPNPIQESLDPGEAALVQEKLNQYNLLFAPPDNHQAMTIVARNQAGRIIAGLVGVTYWGWLHVEDLWVEESRRKQGIGQCLLQAAEEHALQRGCRHVHLETHTFQALGFYEKLGYQVFGELPDLPQGYTKYFLKKDLSAIDRPGKRE